MALCLFIEATVGGPASAVSATGKTLLPWSVGQATKTGDQYACPSGTHLLMSIEEVNAPHEYTLDLEALGITPETVLFVGSAGFAVVLGAFLLGWGVGICKDLIKRIT